MNLRLSNWVVCLEPIKRATKWRRKCKRVHQKTSLATLQSILQGIEEDTSITFCQVGSNPLTYHCRSQIRYLKWNPEGWILEPSVSLDLSRRRVRKWCAYLLQKSLKKQPVEPRQLRVKNDVEIWSPKKSEADQEQNAKSTPWYSMAIFSGLRPQMVLSFPTEPGFWPKPSFPLCQAII